MFSEGVTGSLSDLAGVRCKKLKRKNEKVQGTLSSVVFSEGDTGSFSDLAGVSCKTTKNKKINKKVQETLTSVAFSRVTLAPRLNLAQNK